MTRDSDYDLIIIGGGINGIAIARDAALRGLSVFLAEQKDFGFGASSKTSKLAHGGLRYLKQLHFNVVRECLQERDLLLKNAPALVQKLPFVLPVYRGDTYALWQVKAGLYLYDFLARESHVPSHSNLAKGEIQALFPQLKNEGLVGGCCYYDALMQDSRLLLATMASAEKSGATFCNHTRVSELIHDGGIVNGVVLQDGRKIYGKIVVNATGAWSSLILNKESDSLPFQLKPTKGVHLIIPEVQSQYALVLQAPQDGRLFFLIPWNGYSLLGTTETPFAGNPDHPEVSREDMEYLLEAISFYFPSLMIRPDDVIASFAGLRPLVSQGQESPNLISRDYILHTSTSGLMSILGGKYTTHRLVAEKVVDQVMQRLGKPLTPSPTSHLAVAPLPKEGYLDRLACLYGDGALEIHNYIQTYPGDEEQICPMHPHLFAELRYAVAKEKARSLDDWFSRRTSIAYTPCRGMQCLQKTARYMGALLGWSAEDIDQNQSIWNQTEKNQEIFE